MTQAELKPRSTEFAVCGLIFKTQTLSMPKTQIQKEITKADVDSNTSPTRLSVLPFRAYTGNQEPKWMNGREKHSGPLQPMRNS